MRQIMAAMGLAVLCSSTYVAPLISSTHNTVYHLDGSVTNVFVAVTLNLILMWLFLAATFITAERHPDIAPVVWSIRPFFLPWILLKSVASMTGWNVDRKLSRVVFLLCFLALVSSTFLPKFHRLHVLKLRRQLVSMFLVLLSTGGVVFLLQVVWCGWQSQSLNRARDLHQSSFKASLPSTRRPRVIWLILDELSYKQISESRFPGLHLDAFDQLAAQANVFANASAPSNYTEISVPALISGGAIDQISCSAKGDLRIHSPIRGWAPLNPSDTVFEDALREGYSTGVAGWYNPYCRIVAPVLDRCSWTSQISVGGNLYPDQAITTDLLRPWTRSLSKITALFPGRIGSKADTKQAAEVHIKNYRDLFTEADSLLRQPSIDFVFLHMPVPHPEGIFNRWTNHFTEDGNSSYIHNLALANDYLDHLHTMLSRQGEWDSSAVIVMGDHSWRSSDWRESRVWSPEEEQASDGGKFDERPVYIVKLPHQTVGESLINEHFETVRTRSLLDGIMVGTIKTPQDLASWAERTTAEDSKKYQALVSVEQARERVDQRN